MSQPGSPKKAPVQPNPAPYVVPKVKEEDKVPVPAPAPAPAQVPVPAPVQNDSVDERSILCGRK